MKLWNKFYRLLFLFLAVLLLPTVFISCATKDFDRDINNFRFYISSRVRFESTFRDVDIDSAQTRVMENVVRDRIRISRRTTGRLQSGDIFGSLNISFEERGGNFPTIRFVTRPNDGFYLDWIVDEREDTDQRVNTVQRTNRALRIPPPPRYIYYEGATYTDSNPGREAPHLRYRRDVRESTQSRRMSGLR
jgi:hypothetical protein